VSCDCSIPVYIRVAVWISVYVGSRELVPLLSVYVGSRELVPLLCKGMEMLIQQMGLYVAYSVYCDTTIVIRNK